MALPIKSPYAPMEAQLVDELPEGDGWQYEPKWDGFRCLAFRDGETVELQSKAGQPLTRYFPEVVAMLAALKAPRFVLDGEVVVPADGNISFDDLLLRIHPAASRIKKLAAETPATFIVFDLLVDEAGKPLTDQPLSARRRKLEAFARKHFKTDALRLSPATLEREQARRWFASTHIGLDGVMAKRIEAPYRSGARDAMQKVKRLRSADCVVGGFRYGSKSPEVGSLLLGLYDDKGVLHHVGFTSSFKAAERKKLKPRLEKLKREVSEGGGFTGRAPGGKSRWSTERSGQWVAVKPELVVEVQYDHFSAGRFRHGTKFLRWRPDKLPRQCTLDQVERSGKSSLRLLEAG